MAISKFQARLIAQNLLADCKNYMYSDNPISYSVLDTFVTILSDIPLNFKPAVYPTLRESILLEFSIDSLNFLEFEILDSSILGYQEVNGVSSEFNLAMKEVVPFIVDYFNNLNISELDSRNLDDYNSSYSKEFYKLAFSSDT